MQRITRTYNEVPWSELIQTYGKLFIIVVCIVLPFIILEELEIIPKTFNNARLQDIYENSIVAGLFASGFTFLLLLYQVLVKVFQSEKIYDKSEHDTDEV